VVVLVCGEVEYMGDVGDVSDVGDVGGIGGVGGVVEYIGVYA
jgi:hypothetical protein